MNKEQLQEAYDSMTARCATLQNKVFSLQSYERENASLSLSCSKLSKDWISVDHSALNGYSYGYSYGAKLLHFRQRNMFICELRDKIVLQKVCSYTQ